MSRHRIVRTMDYNDEYDGYDDIYGHSVEDEHCISPTDAQQWLYDRARGQQSISAFISKNKDIKRRRPTRMRTRTPPSRRLAATPRASKCRNWTRSSRQS